MPAEEITVTTNASGDATAYLPTKSLWTGKVLAISYTKVDYDNGVRFVITTERGAQGLWDETAVNASKQVRPSALLQDQVGVNTTQRDYVRASEERIKIVVSLGGNAKSGKFRVIVGF